MKWDGSPLDQAARILEDVLEGELGERPYRVEEPKPGTLILRYPPYDIPLDRFQNAIECSKDAIPAEVRATNLDSQPDRVHDQDRVAVLTGLPFRRE